MIGRKATMDSGIGLCRIFLFAALVLCVACSSQFKKTPRPGDTIKEDIPLIGYQTWVDFNVSGDEVYAYLQDTDNVAKAFSFIEFEERGGDTGRLDAPGDGIHFSTTVLGLPFKGRMVLTYGEFGERSEIFHVMSVWSRQQWWTGVPEEGEVRLYLRFITELPDMPFIYSVLSPDIIVGRGCRLIDLSLDRVKADIEGMPLPERLPGSYRGEMVSSTVRIYRTSIRIERPKRQVYEYIIKPDNFNRASEFLHLDPSTDTGVINEVGHLCRITSTPAAPFDLSGTSLVVESEQDDLIHHLIYFEKSLAGFIVKLRKRGADSTLLEYTFYYQIPDYSSEELVTTLHAVSRLDEALRLALSNIKSEMEAGR